MRFRYDGREFDGPALGVGWQEGFTIGELRWAKKQLKVSSTDDLDTAEGFVLWAVLAIRRADHTILPIHRFDELSMHDFEPLPHPIAWNRQRTGCLDCGNVADSVLHEDQGEAPDPTGPAPETQTA